MNEAVTSAGFISASHAYLRGPTIAIVIQGMELTMPMPPLTMMTTMTSQGELQWEPQPRVLAQSILSPGHSTPIKITTIIGHSQSQSDSNPAPSEIHHTSFLAHEPNAAETMALLSLPPPSLARSVLP
jgi:hypothetical protein